jgi:hypothetical protein
MRSFRNISALQNWIGEQFGVLTGILIKTALDKIKPTYAINDEIWL